MSSTLARIMVLSPSQLAQLSTVQLHDAFDYCSPDALLFTAPSAASQFRATIRQADTITVPLLTPGGTSQPEDPDIYHVGGTDLVVATTDAQLATLADLEHTDALDPTTPTYIITDRLAISLQLTTLSASLDGEEAYKQALSPASLDGRYIHLSTAAPVGYYRDWGDLTVCGAAPPTDATTSGSTQQRAAGAPISTLQLHSDGMVCITDISPSQLGLRTLKGVGAKTAKRLQRAGYSDRHAIATAPLAHLLDIDNIGQTTGEQIQAHAQALIEGTVIRSGDTYFPHTEPVFIDIETDGLTPTIVWLIGALDRKGDTDEENDSYMSFLTRNPDIPGNSVEAFMLWYAANAAHRPIAAYNGRSFDFLILQEHIERYCPEYLDVWEDAFLFDPYAWAVKDNNALLPARTNRLADVAAALGWETDDTGLTGAAVGRAYRRWMREQSADVELEWKRHETYCEDDVRALAYVYDALNAAGRTATTTDQCSDVPTTETTIQGQLTDFQ